MPLDDLQTILAAVIAELNDTYALQPLFSLEDWHKHDGFISHRDVSDWASLVQIAQRTERLIASGMLDYDVYRAFYPADLSFLLRFLICENESGDHEEFSGMIDLSSDSRVIVQVRTRLPSGVLSLLVTEPSKAFFDRTHDA